MPVTKQYLRYESSGAFGVVCSRKTGALLINEKKGKDQVLAAISPALEHVIIWNLKTSQKIGILAGERHEVTSLSSHAPSLLLAVGYEDGAMRLFSLESHDCHVTFSGHKSAVISLAFDQSGARLVSGGKDTDVIIWDVINECGLYRLKGHKGPITWCHFMREKNVLITCSKDTFVKFWDLDTQHCYQTLTEHRSEIWEGLILRNETRLLTLSSDNQLRIYQLTSNGTNVSRACPLYCECIGELKRQISGRPLALKSDIEGHCLAVMSSDTVVEVYIVRSDEEIDKLKRKRIRKSKKKAQECGQEWVESMGGVSAKDEFSHIFNFKSKHKMKSCDLWRENNDTYQILLSLHSNMLELHTLSLSCSSSSLLHSISLPGHRSDIRCVCLSSNGSLMASGSSDMIKIWTLSSPTNDADSTLVVSNTQCLHTVSCGYVVSMTFVPGDRHILVGTKSGEVLLYEIASGSLLETFSAHTRPVWAVGVAPGRRGFVTGSADHDVKFWDFELISDKENPGRKRLTAAHVKTLKMSEDVLCLKHSSNEKYLAVSLLDSTVKIFFADTLKFYLSLYGHKLPVLGMDISSDNTLLVSASADKNIRIWGLDFGDCHRSIFAHNDSIMSIQFVPQTHLCFSVSKDKMLKQWDCDNFELIQTLQGHQAEVWTLAVSNDGNTIVTGSHDLSLRKWACTQEPLVLSEEKENEREMEFEKSIAEGEEPVVPGEMRKGETGMAGKKTINTIESTERLLEAIEIWREEVIKMEEYKTECEMAGEILPALPTNPVLKILGNISAERHVLNVLKKIRSSDLEEALLFVPFSVVIDLLKLIDLWVSNEWEVELTSRCLLFLLKVHHHQIITSQLLSPIMDSLCRRVPSTIETTRDMYGFNLSAMKHLLREMDSTDSNTFTDLTSVQSNTTSQRSKKKRSRL